MCKLSLGYLIRKCRLQNLCLPKGTVMTAKESCIVFKKKDKKAVLKQNRLEMSNLLKCLKKTKTYSEETIKSCHLKTTPYYLDILNYDNLQSVIRLYFK